jgi:2-keto-4-pentenoate hydratase/2-oxohepta-3-ene-1,7-dioic acid hydratase in catechol pathway
MKVATVSVAGERRVGRIAADGRSIAPFDLLRSEAQDAFLALIRRDGAGMPPPFSPMRLADVTLEAAKPAPRRNIFCVGKNNREHAHQFAPSGFDTSSSIGFHPPKYLKDGDVVRIEIGGIGVLENQIMERPS